jgi:hypothetical protein
LIPRLFASKIFEHEIFTAFSIDIMRSMIFSLSSKSFRRAVSRVSRPDLLSWKYRSARKTSKKIYWWEIYLGLEYWGVGWGEEILGKGGKGTSSLMVLNSRFWVSM